MRNAGLVFVGGGTGAAMRYWLGGAVQRLTGSVLPYGTLTVNVLGCLVIGVLMVGMEERFLINPSLRLFLTIGILGGFTTFSSFSYETVTMIRDTEYFYAAMNIFGTLTICFFATYVGTVVGKLL